MRSLKLTCANYLELNMFAKSLEFYFLVVFCNVFENCSQGKVRKTNSGELNGMVLLDCMVEIVGGDKL